jgi:hypothetical protein
MRHPKRGVHAEDMFNELIIGPVIGQVVENDQGKEEGGCRYQYDFDFWRKIPDFSLE